MASISARLLFVTGVHGIFSQYGDIMAACFNLMNVPIKGFFNESVQHHYGPLTDETFELVFSACASSMFLGLMIGFAIMGYLMDHVGRKETGVVIRGAFGILGSVCMILSYLTGRCEFYVLGHIFAGIVTGLKVVLIIYVAECSPDDKRGLTTMAVNSGGVMMVMLVTPLCLPELMGSSTMWFLLPCICALLATVHLCIASNFPQSPKQLFIQKHDEVAARNAIQFYYGNEHDPDFTIAEMQNEKHDDGQKSVSLIEIVKNKTHRFAFFLVLLCAFVPVFSAVNIKSQYLCSMLMTYGLTQSQSTTAMMVISAASLPVCFCSPFLISRYGRRPIFLAITILCALEWVGLGAAQILVDVHATELTLAWLSACMASVLGQSAVNMGLLIMSPIVISEICPQNTRAAISQLTQVVPIAFAVAEVTLFPALRTSFGASLFFFLGASCAALGVVLHTQMMDSRALAVGRPKPSEAEKPRLLSRDGSWRGYGSTSSSDLSIASIDDDDEDHAPYSLF